MRDPRSAGPDVDGPLSRDAATALLDRAAELLDDGEPMEAARHYRRVIGFDDAGVTAAALLGLGEALRRLDREDDAIATWSQVVQLPETPSTYHAWRNIAAARVREGDLRAALDAYREAERRAPAEDRAEIASRLGWLSKELGDRKAAGRYFSRARGDIGLPLTAFIIGASVVVSFTALSAGGGFVIDALALSKPAVADGEAWRLWTVTLVHANLLHLLFNMYALWLAGPLVEQMYGRLRFLAFYLVCAAGGSIATYAFGEVPGGVGASGAVFGLFGILLAAGRTHNPVIDRQSRMLIGQIGGLIAINLVFGFVVPGIDNLAHLGGLGAGLWLGFLVRPTRVATLRTMWQRPAGSGPGTATAELAARVVGLVALVALLVAGFVIGTARWG